INWGREALLALARRTGGWVGWEAATLRSIAGDLALVPLDERGVRIAGDVEIAALVDRALTGAVAGKEVSAGFASLAGGLGFRKAVRDAVLELRTAGIAPGRIRARTARGTPAYDVALVLERFECLLDAHRLADSAAVFRSAIEAFDREAPYVLDGELVVAPGLRDRGLPGQLLARLAARGARTLAGEAAEGPHGSAGLSLFAAASPVNEIREVLRRALEAGATWDQVEIITTDPDTYGLALDAVAARCGISCSFLTGHSLSLTRVGRALERWLDWLGDGLPADLVREALEAGDLSLPDSPIASTALARTFRSLGIGWGRARYDDAVRRLRDPGHARARGPREDEDAAAFEARVAAAQASADALAALLDRLLAVTPEVPERGSDRQVHTSVDALAEATLAWLELLPLHGEVEQRTASRLRNRILQLASLEGEETTFGAALAELRDGLADLRAWTEASDHRKPWSSHGGAVHLTDIAHGGLTGRPFCYVVGLDADRVAGPRVQDAMLNDESRIAIDGQNLPTTAVRREERARLVAATLARLRGTVTLSFSVTGSDGAAVGSAHQLLDAFRLQRGDPSLDYEALRKALGVPACAVPSGREPLDAREVWLASLVDGPLLLDGEAPVRAAFASLDHGLRAAAERDGADLTRHHGLIAAAAGRFDPRKSARPLSASSLELLAKCPLAWFYSYGLGVKPPEDPEYDPETWLSAMERGSLLHALFERFARSYAGRQREIVESAAENAIIELADDLLGEWREKVPPPSEAVFESEATEIRQSARAFLQAERDAIAGGTDGKWLEFELRFGHDSLVELALGDGKLQVHGFIDRVDQLADGRLRVIDYKTGRSTRYRQNDDLGPFNAGRNLQAAVYAAGAKAKLGADVATFEYRFPTVKGESESVVYGTADFAAAASIIDGLLTHIMKGEYVPTTECDDCRYCDYGPVCRVSLNRFGKVDSIRARWAAESAAGIPAYQAMLARRSGS
ncbi:MAG TPA: PD-(D/E)XK nuclease family protein, partial [Gemmatimonadales bacterium]|nr:PD-(D/E)XK nuclease family protein [Gemmatimonadales bacterium]